MDFKRLTYGLILAAALSSAIVACSTKKDSNPSAPGVGAFPPCMGAGCTGGYNTGNRRGFFTQNNAMEDFYRQMGYAPSGTSMNIGGPYRNIVKYAMGACDRNYYNGGLAGCDEWVNGFNDMIIIAENPQASTVKLVLRSLPNTTCTGPSCGWYSYSLPSFEQFALSLFGFPTGNPYGIYLPLVLNATVWPINNNLGFELRANGPAGSATAGHMFQLMVMNGKFEDTAWDYELYFNVDNSTTSSSGRMVRCHTHNCGVQGL